MLSFFPLDVLDEIWDLIESVSEGFPTYSVKASLASSLNGYMYSNCTSLNVAVFILMANLLFQG